MVMSQSSHHRPKAGEGWERLPGRRDDVCRGPEPPKGFLATITDFLGPETKLLEMDCQALSLERWVGVRL